MRKRDMLYAFLVWLAALAVGRVALWIIPMWFNVAVVSLLAMVCIVTAAIPLGLRMYHDSKWSKHEKRLAGLSENTGKDYALPLGLNDE